MNKPFTSKHCSPISYGSPLEKESCGSPNKQIDPKAISQAVEDAKEYRDYVKRETKPYKYPGTGDGPTADEAERKGFYERATSNLVKADGTVKALKNYAGYHIGKKMAESKGRDKEVRKQFFEGQNTKYKSITDPNKIKQIKKDLNIKH
jgi:hypothetical protein